MTDNAKRETPLVIRALSYAAGNLNREIYLRESERSACLALGQTRYAENLESQIRTLRNFNMNLDDLFNSHERLVKALRDISRLLEILTSESQLAEDALDIASAALSALNNSGDH